MREARRMVRRAAAARLADDAHLLPDLDFTMLKQSARTRTIMVDFLHTYDVRFCRQNFLKNEGRTVCPL
jgi:hypothetical protein